MSDWEDEPVAAAPAAKSNADDDWADLQPEARKSKEVADWSDDETDDQPADGGGDVGGFRERRDGAGGGSRGRGGGGGYRWRRDDAEGGGGDGGYRGRRDDGEGGGGGGGYRGRRDDNNEDVMQMLRLVEPCSVRVPSSYDICSVQEFMDNMEQNSSSNQTLANQRKQRDYLLSAFEFLVNIEMERLNGIEREQRKQKSQALCDEIDNADRRIAEMNRLLADIEDEHQQQSQLDTNIMAIRELQPHDDTFVVPGTSTSVIRRSERLATTTPIRTAEATTTGTRTPRRRGGARGSPNRAPQEFRPHQIVQLSQLERIKELLRTFGEMYDGNTNVASAAAISTTSRHVSPPLSIFQPRLREDFVGLHEMRRISVCPTGELRQELSWPHLSDETVWLCHKSQQKIRSLQLLFLADNNAETEEARQQRQLEDQTSSLVNQPRQQPSQSRSQNEETPDYATMQTRVQSSPLDNEASADAIRFWANSNDGPTAMELASSGNQINLTEEDELMMLPPQLPLDMNSALLSTPVQQSYHPKLSAIEEEQQRKTSTMGRVVEMHGCPPPATPIATGGALAITDSSTPSTSLPIPAPWIPSPIPSRDWTSIFRPLDSLPNYAGLQAPERRVRRRRMVRNSSERIEAAQPRSNHEITIAFMANLLQAVVHEADTTPVDTAIPQQPNEQLPEIQSIHTAIPQQPNEQLPEIQSIEQTSTTEPSNQVMERILPPEPQDTPIATAISTNLQLSDKPIVTSMIILTTDGEIINAAQPNLQNYSSSTRVQPTNDESMIMVNEQQQPITDESMITVNEQQSLINDESMNAQQQPINDESMIMVNAQQPPINDEQQQSTQYKRPSAADRMYSENLESLNYIVKNTHMLRLMIDHTKQLSDEQQQEGKQLVPFSRQIHSLGGDDTGVEQPGHRYVSLPAVYTYDPQILLDMPDVKRRVVHKLIGALIMFPKVDMRTAPFITTRMEAAICYRVLFELKAVKIIELSSDARYASLC